MSLAGRDFTPSSVVHPPVSHMNLAHVGGVVCSPAATAATALCPWGGREQEVTVMPGRVTEMLTLCGGGTPGTPVETGWLKVWTPVKTDIGPCRRAEHVSHGKTTALQASCRPVCQKVRNCHRESERSEIT